MIISPAPGEMIITFFTGFPPCEKIRT